MNFQGKTVLVTGASRGIGEKIAEEFAKRGANIVLNYHQSKKRAEELKIRLISEYKVKVCAIKADISQEEEIEEMIEKALETFSTIDVLVNNAGIAIDTTYEDKTKENFMRTIEVNLVGTFLVTKKVGEIMKKQKKGAIINISSTNGIDTEYIESLDYDASKAGVISLTKNLAKYFGPEIRVNAIAPGWVETEMNQELAQEFKNEETDKIILNRFALPEEIAKVVAFLASEDASYITGSIIRVDGGMK